MDNENEFNDSQEIEKKEEGISSDLIRGHINTIILRTLATGDKYGYEIIDEIESKSQGQYSIKQPTLYSALKRLESLGYVTSYWGGSSGGGRRRYFQITEAGTAFYTRNQEEWLYSRSIIDSLISENQPAPVPVVEEVPVANEEQIEPSIEEEVEEIDVPSEEETEEFEDEIEEEVKEEIEEIEEEVEEKEDDFAENTNLSTLRENDEEEEEIEESPYVSKPSTGAYKEVIGELYNNAIDTADEPVKVEKRVLPKAEPQQITGNIEFFNILEQAEYDGIKVKTSGVYKPKVAIEETDNPTAFFNKGKAMFFSSIATFAFVLVEFIITLVMADSLGVTVAYPLVIIALGVGMVAIFTSLFLMGFGKNTIATKSSTFLILSVIIFAVLVLLISALAISNQAILSDGVELLRTIVIPSVVAFNIVIFALFYRFFKQRT